MYHYIELSYDMVMWTFLNIITNILFRLIEQDFLISTHHSKNNPAITDGTQFYAWPLTYVNVYII